MHRDLSKTKLLTRAEAAEFLGVTVGTLAVWHSTGRYKIPVVKVGRSCRYRLADLEAWIDSRTVGAGEHVRSRTS